MTSMADLPSRVIAQVMGDDLVPLPHGNAHKTKRTHEERLQQMREWYWANRARVSMKRRAKYAAMHAVIHEQRLAEIVETAKAIEAQRLAWVNRGDR